MATLRVDDAAFRREREVVKEERRMRIENQPYGRLSEIIYDNAFLVHPYKHPTIGSMADLEAASIEDVRDFHSTYYVPENATVTIVGDFDTAQALQLVNQYFGRVPKAARPVPRDIPKEPPMTQEKRAVVEESWPLPAVVVAYHITYDGHPDSYPLHIASKILSDGQSARILARAGLQQAAVPQRVRHAATSSSIRTCSLPCASCSRGRPLAAAEKALIDEFEKLKTRRRHDAGTAARAEPVRARLHPQPRVERGQGEAPVARGGDPQRHHHRRRRVRHLHADDGRRRPARGADLLQPDQPHGPAHRAEGERAMNPERRCQLPSVAAVAAGAVGAVWCWRVGRLSCARAQPARRFPTGRPSGRRGRWPAREVKFPPYEMRTLAERHAGHHRAAPRAAGRQHAAAGARRVGAGPAGQGGRGEPGGVAPRPGHDDARAPQQIADQIDFIGGALGTGSGSDLSFVNVIVMKDSFDVGMDLLADVARNPAFAAEEIERQKQQVISNLQVNQGDPDYVASVLFDRLVYGFHPYGLPNSGTPETLAAITRADLQAYHRRNFVPNNMILAIVGDVTSQEAFAAAERVFGGWPRGEIRAAQDRRAAAADAPHRHRRQAGRRADRDPRRSARDSAQAPGLPGVGSGGEDPRRRRGQPAAPRAALRARADLRRRRPTPRRGSRPATSSPRPTRARKRRAKRCG